MMAPPSGAWSGGKQLVAAHWDSCQRVPPRSQTSYDNGLVAQMRACGNPDTRGYSADRCLPGGQGKPLVAMRGTASCGRRCATVSVDTWGNQGRKARHEGVSYRHLILTVPAMVRTPCSQHAAVI